MKNLSLYIHIPFCARKCPYCSFFSQAGKSSLWKAYFDALKQEIDTYKKILKTENIDTMYVGGGTPSLVDPILIGKLLEYIYESFQLSKKVEIAIEANPESLDVEKLKVYRDANINRLSIGVQTTSDTLLKKLGRQYSFYEFKQKFYMAREAGFSNINIDLMLGLPGQTLVDWDDSLTQVIDLQPEHIACYSLELDDTSVWGRMNEMRTFEIPDQKLDRMMYKKAGKLLMQAGYTHYEISNWAKKGYECRHNLHFWKYMPYIGIGAGAHTFFKHKRWQNEESIERYINRHSDGKQHMLNVSNRQAAQEKLMLGLRLLDGLPISEIESNYLKSKQKVISKLRINGLLCKNESVMRLTKKGLDVENYVIDTLIND